jgi:hypothetical protein
MSESFARQATVWVDSSGGSNRNSGVDSGHAFKTWSEVRRRIGGAGGLFRQATTINVPNGLPNGDPMIVDFGVDTDSTSISSGLTIVGPYTNVGPAGTVATARPRNHSTRTFNGITSSTGGFDWSPYVASNILVTGTGGVINGATSWVASNDGAALATLSPFIGSSNFTEQTITNGDTYTFTQLARVDAADLRCARGALNVKGFVFTNVVGVTELVRGGVTLRECSFESTQIWNARAGLSVFANCRFRNPSTFGNYNLQDNSATVFAGLYINNGSHTLGGGGMIFKGGGNLAVLQGVLFLNSSISVDHGAYVQIADAQFKGGTLDYTGIRVYRHARTGITSISGVVDSPSPWGMQLDNGANVMLFPGTHNLVGSSPGVNDIIMPDGTFVAWSQAENGVYHWNGTEASIGPQI